ncbi:hypothetical protein FRB94_004923 [Tulasnella sp. JGI-2019a]|nr:hypothetical protein FRB94_004923 [Tulasnella sp. JGI-2019a]KAG9025747.1 hypothetical protein FRB95_009814 [Tulasnella sp. JGI-2019a]
MGKKSKQSAANSSATSKKRPAADSQVPNKKRKTTTTKGKQKAQDKSHIAIPDDHDRAGEDHGMDEDDVKFFGSDAISFLQHLDRKAISESKKSTAVKKKSLPKPVRPKHLEDDLPPVDDHSDDEEDWSSDFVSLEGSEIDIGSEEEQIGSSEDELEDAYERRSRHTEENSKKGAARLPVKLLDGTVKHRGHRPAEIAEPESSEEESDDSDEETEQAAGPSGSQARVEAIPADSRKARVRSAQEEIAVICQEIVTDPENNLNSIRRLHAFTQPTISSATSTGIFPNDPVVQKLALLSELAVFKDVAPGYRIRPLTDVEKAAKVTKDVLRQRDYEESLLALYQTYLKTLESEIKNKTGLAEVSLRCMCTLLTDLTHFNYRVNIMHSVVAALSKKSWTNTSDMCLSSVITIFRADSTGVPSLELVRLLNRMIKERHYRVHPNVLSCLLYLRLKTELAGVRASAGRATKDAVPKKPMKMRKKDKKALRPHLSKKAKDTKKELEGIQREMDEAEAEVDLEDRAVQHTETLKLLFVLYFSIIKNPRPTRLLPSALEGIARYAHLINIDFFRDLLVVLKKLCDHHKTILLSGGDDEEDGDDAKEVEENDLPKDPYLRYRELLRRRLLCITTAFELLSGQGDAITIDLGDFIDHLYIILLEVAVAPDIEDVPIPASSNPTVQLSNGTAPPKRPVTPSKKSTQSIADVLFQALTLVFHSRVTSHNTPPWRTAAFAKRTLVACLLWPSNTVLRGLEFVHTLMVKEPKVEALLSTEDRSSDGVYRGELDDPQLCNAFASSFWELRMLERSHPDDVVRREAKKLANFVRA